MTRKDVHIRLSGGPKYYMHKVYSTAPNCYFHDLLDNGAGNNPRYYHVFVGVNTRYLEAYPLNSKTNADVQQTLTQFINKYHPEKLTSDEESAFTSKSTCDLCTRNKVKLYIVQDKNHSSLSVLDRVIRTLRDMNTPKHYREQSTDKQFNYFSIAKMNQLKHAYNNKFNSTIKCTPQEMFNDKSKEIDFITRMQQHKSFQRGIKDFKLKDGTYVRFRLDKKPLTKHRYNYTFESYKVSGREGANYILTAADGTTTTKPRYKLLPCDVRVYPLARSLSNNRGVVERIISHNPRTNKYTVKYENWDETDEIPASYLRGRHPQRMSQMERDYFNAQRPKHSLSKNKK